jgi:hypothetical protein
MNKLLFNYNIINSQKNILNNFLLNNIHKNVLLNSYIEINKDIMTMNYRNVENLSYNILKNTFSNINYYKNENQICYKKNSKKIDYVLYSDYLYNKTSVEVTRFNNKDSKNIIDIMLKNKICQINNSTNNVIDNDKWNKAILHIFTNYDERYVIDKWLKLEHNLEINTCLLLTRVYSSEYFF